MNIDFQDKDTEEQYTRWMCTLVGKDPTKVSYLERIISALQSLFLSIDIMHTAQSNLYNVLTHNTLQG